VRALARTAHAGEERKEWRGPGLGKEKRKEARGREKDLAQRWPTRGEDGRERPERRKWAREKREPEGRGGERKLGRAGLAGRRTLAALSFPLLLSYFFPHSNIQTIPFEFK
jgi:hypothetical protein